MAVSQIATTDTPAVTPIKSTLTGPFERNSAGTSFGSNVDVDVIDNTSTATRVIAETTPEAESTIGEATGQEGGNATAVIPLLQHHQSRKSQNLNNRACLIRSKICWVG